MKKYFRLGLLFLIFILPIAASEPGLAREIQNSEALGQTMTQAGLPWRSMYVQREPDPVLDVGGYVSMALRPFDDYPVIAYYNSTDEDLMVAIPVLPHTGNCGSYEMWFCDAVDGDTDSVGMYSSLDIWGESNQDWKIGISYYDTTERSLKATIWFCSVGVCIRDYITVQEPVSSDWMVGLYSSFKFDVNGNAGIAYFKQNVNYEDNDLMFAYQVPFGGNCGAGGAATLWECEWISSVSTAGSYASLDFSFNDLPYIAYYHGDGSLQIAYHVSNFPSCEEMDWTCLSLDSAGADVGSFASLTAPQHDGDPYRIAYHDKTNGTLKFYSEDEGASVVDDEMGTSLDPMGISMQLDLDGYPAIAYQKIGSEFSPPSLWLARPNFVYDDGEPGNCGDAAYWRCIPLDTGNQYVSEAEYASLGVNSLGRLAVAYSELDENDYFRSLKFIYQYDYRYTFLPLTTK